VSNREVISSVPSTPTTPTSCRTYERLLAGETVAWRQIVAEHPLLGTITVGQLIRAGAVVVKSVTDPATGETETQLSLHPARCSPRYSHSRRRATNASPRALGRPRARTNRLLSGAELGDPATEAQSSMARDPG